MANEWQSHAPSEKTGRNRIEQILSDTNSTGSDSGSSSSSSSSSSSGSSSSSSSSSSEKSKDATMSVDILSTYEDALRYAEMMWNKLQRDNGRSVECQVWGSCNWKVGEWMRVYLPSFFIDGYMYITACSQNNDSGDWVATLTLKDYPPGWGKYEEPEQEDEEDESEDDEEE